jgi:hypothetical protein
LRGEAATKGARTALSALRENPRGSDDVGDSTKVKHETMNFLPSARSFKASSNSRRLFQIFPGLLMGLLWMAESFAGTNLPSPPPQSAAALKPCKAEIKLFVTAASAEQASRALKLDEHRAVKELVCFFDTSDGALEAGQIILRARQEAGKLGESTVKFRDTASPAELNDTERAVKHEQDWTSETNSTLSHSLNRRSLPEGLVTRVARGKAGVDELFNKAQRKLAESRVRDFDWKSLKCYGPVEVKVWRQQWKLEGISEPVTVELWHLEKDGRVQDILEVSAKGRAETAEQIQVLALRFYEAARVAGLGEPAGQTKTKMVLDYFKPGR